MVFLTPTCVVLIETEMRTPLFSIIGWTELLLDMNLTEKQEEIVNTITFCSRHMLGIINQVLDYSKIENKKLKIESIPFHVADVISKTGILTSISTHAPVDSFACSVKEGVCLERDLDEETLSTIVKVANAFLMLNVLKGDPHKLTQCLTNVISNALKFTKQGKVSVSCKTKVSRNLRKAWVKLSGMSCLKR